jgi:hypothetical protein
MIQLHLQLGEEIFFVWPLALAIGAWKFQDQ